MRRALMFVLASVSIVAACGGATPPAKVAHADPAYDAACAGVAPEHQAMCPMRWVKSMEEVPGGVVLHLDATAPAGPELEKRMKCHRAWMTHEPQNDMPGCPVGSPGLDISAASGAAGPDLKLVASSDADVAEVRRRAHAKFDPK